MYRWKDHGVRAAIRPRGIFQLPRATRRNASSPPARCSTSGAAGCRGEARSHNLADRGPDPTLATRSGGPAVPAMPGSVCQRPQRPGGQPLGLAARPRPWRNPDGGSPRGRGSRPPPHCAPSRRGHDADRRRRAPTPDNSRAVRWLVRVAVNIAINATEAAAHAPPSRRPDSVFGSTEGSALAIAWVDQLIEQTKPSIGGPPNSAVRRRSSSQTITLTNSTSPTIPRTTERKRMVRKLDATPIQSNGPRSATATPRPVTK